jgi:multiple sugar transport system permease protein
MSSNGEAATRSSGGALSRLADRHFAALALGPIIGLLAAAAVIPFAVSLYLSFTDFSFNLPGHNGAFVGLSNYRQILADDRFHASLRTQLLFLLSTIPCEFFAGLWIAASLHSIGEIRNRLLPFLVVPMLLAPVTVGMIWRLLLHGDYGPIGYYLTRLPPLQGSSILGNPILAFFAIAIVDIWQWTPFFTVVILAGLLNLPEAPFRAAAVDGASRSRMFWTITVPLLRPTLTVGLLVRSMDSFKEFDKIFVLTRGGPASSTELTSVYTWIVSFDHGALGYGSAITVAIYLLVYAGSIAIFRIMRRDWIL